MLSFFISLLPVLVRSQRSRLQHSWESWTIMSSWSPLATAPGCSGSGWRSSWALAWKCAPASVSGNRWKYENNVAPWAQRSRMKMQPSFCFINNQLQNNSISTLIIRWEGNCSEFFVFSPYSTYHIPHIVFHCACISASTCVLCPDIQSHTGAPSIRICPAQGEQQCAVSTTCSISRQASSSSGGDQTVLFPPQWYSTCSLACSHPCCPPPVQCNDTHTHAASHTHHWKTGPDHSSNLAEDQWSKQNYL